MSSGPVAFIMDGAEVTSGQYDAVMARMDLVDTLPAGAIYHAAGPTDAGWRVVDLWQNDEAYRTFAETLLGPTVRAMDDFRSDIERIELTGFLAGAEAGSSPAFLHILRLPGLDAKAFESLAARARADGPPPGLVFNANGRYADGWCVIALWTSRQARDAFFDARLRHVLADTPLTNAPVFEDLELYATAGRAPGSP
jgi:hypothetical protein